MAEDSVSVIPSQQVRLYRVLRKSGKETDVPKIDDPLKGEYGD